MSLADDLLDLGYSHFSLDYDGSLQAIHLTVDDRTLMISVDSKTTNKEIVEIANKWLNEYRNRRAE